ncbi:MAG: hypothetical protein ACR2QF_06115 [Geminicoccaceae bacterium]
MMRQHDASVQPGTKLSKNGQFLRKISARNRPQIVYRHRISKKMAILGMAIGYLGLVVILASTPIWSQVLLPHQSPHLACTEAGGTR